MRTGRPPIPPAEDDTMTDIPTHRRPPSRPTVGYLAALALGTALLAGLLTACDGGSPIPAAAAPTDGAGAGPGNTSKGTAGRGGPAASGLIAEIDGDTLQVQNASTGQVAVKVTSKTAYTQTKAATLADVTVGSCVFASAATSTNSAASSGPSASAPTASAAPSSAPSAITATIVQISKASGGSCGDGQLGGPAGTRPSGAPTGQPSNLPSGVRPTDGTARRLALGDVLTGKVTAVSGSTISVQVTARAAAGQTGSPTASPTTTVGTITVTSSTTFMQTVAATRAAVRVGLCATATGPTDSTGAVTATQLALSAADANGCTTGFVRGGAAGSATGSNG
jgi:hypothetical protein